MKTDPQIAASYVRENFEPSDRLAVVLIDKRAGSVIQRLASAESIAGDDFQAWLHGQNQQRYEVYLSMNALKPAAQGRTKGDIAIIRHLYLDFDETGTAAVRMMLEHAELPRPHYLINTSPDKWQGIWKVEGFRKEQAEDLQKSLARQFGADPAATDCARVMRLPGFINHKYTEPHLVSVEQFPGDRYRPEQFPTPPTGRLDPRSDRESQRTYPQHRNELSQSERDWAYAKRALTRGESPASVIAAIARFRQDKHNPQYYAELTVRKATDALREDTGRDDSPPRV